MTQERELDLLLDAFFVDGTNELADRVLDAALDQIDHTHQRRREAVLRRFTTMSMPVRLAAAAVISVLAIGGAFLLMKPNSGVGNSPTPSPSPKPAWITTGAPTEPGATYQAVRLQDGRVLMMGPTSSAEIYDPATGQWGGTRSMQFERGYPAAALLADGRVLVTGGGGQGSAVGELFDPVNGAWSPTEWLVHQRQQPSATTLRDGRVLVIGGDGGGDLPLASTAETYDGSTGKWTETGRMQVGRANAALVVMQDGHVLAAGGFAGDLGTSLGNTAEIYDPATDTWTATGNMTVPRVFAASTMLSDGRVLVVGGQVPSADIYDPATGTWTATGPVPSLSGDYVVSILLPDGSVLVTGGDGTSARLDPAAGTWSPVASGPAGAFVRSATPLTDGRVLVVEGTATDTGSNIPSELFDPTALP